MYIFFMVGRYIMIIDVLGAFCCRRAARTFRWDRPETHLKDALHRCAHGGDLRWAYMPPYPMNSATMVTSTNRRERR